MIALVTKETVILINLLNLNHAFMLVQLDQKIDLMKKRMTFFFKTELNEIKTCLLSRKTINTSNSSSMSRSSDGVPRSSRIVSFTSKDDLRDPDFSDLLLICLLIPRSFLILETSDLMTDSTSTSMLEPGVLAPDHKIKNIVTFNYKYYSMTAKLSIVKFD